jgi:hypothetical protein
MNRLADDLTSALCVLLLVALETVLKPLILFSIEFHLNLATIYTTFDPNGTPSVRPPSFADSPLNPISFPVTAAQNFTLPCGSQLHSFLRRTKELVAQKKSAAEAADDE